MAKVTFIDDLAKAYETSKRNRAARAESVYKNKNDHLHWNQVVAARNRRVMGIVRRKAGKSNRLGGRATPYGRVLAMQEMNFMAQVCRTNRKLGGYTLPIIIRIGGDNDQ